MKKTTNLLSAAPALRTLAIAALSALALLPLAAQDETPAQATFTVAAMNVDGLPPTLAGITLNKDAKEEAGATGIGNKLATKGYDFVGLSEDFNYHESLITPLDGIYTSGTWRGKINSALEGIGALLGNPFDTDGLGLLWKSSVTAADESWTMWTDRNGTTSNGSDELIAKGYRHYAVTLGETGIVIDVFQLHMDAETDDADLAARESQMAQLAADIIGSYDNGRPKLVMGDTNCRYTRDYLRTKFIDVVASDGKYDVRDAWVEYCRQGIYPTYGSDALMVGELGYVKGEIVDKIIYMNPTAANCAKLRLNSFAVDTDFNDESGEPLADHYPVTANFTATAATVTASASDHWTWKCEQAAGGSSFYLYNVGYQAFLRSDGYLLPQPTDASIWLLTADGDGYTIACEDGTEARLALGGIKTGSGATTFTFVSSTTTEGAYKFKSTYWGGTRYFNPTDRQGNFSENGASTASANNDWLLISAEQVEAYTRYCAAYADAVEILGLLPVETSTSEALYQLLSTDTDWTDQTTTPAIEAQVQAVDAWFTDRTDLIANPSFELGTKLGDGAGSKTYVLGWTVAEDAEEAFSSSVVDDDEGDDIRAFTPIDGSYVFNTWGGTPAEGYYCRQTLASLPAGYYELTATFASESGNTVDLLFGDEKANTGSLANRPASTTVTIRTYWAGGDCTIGALSSTWFEADNFRLRAFDYCHDLTLTASSLDGDTQTYYSTLALPYNATVPDGLTLYYATRINEATIHCEPFASGTTLAAGTPVVVSATGEGVYRFLRTDAEADLTNPTDNLLLGTPSAPLTEKESGSTYYVLSRRDGNVLFARLAEATRIPQYKAYLKATSEEPAQIRLGFGDETDAIRSLSPDSADTPTGTTAVYAPDGTRLSHLRPGLNILRTSDGTTRKILIR